MGEDGLLLITPEDIRKHNTEKSGSWLVIAGKVYDVESLSMQVIELLLATCKWEQCTHTHTHIHMHTLSILPC